MNVSLNWLRQYVDIDLSPEEISEILTTIGLEVEGMKEVESIKGGLRGIVIGHVLTCEKHPNADKLSKTTVDIGEDEPLSIVCGAPNVAAGQKVLVATVGTTLYAADGEPWKIKKGKIRGEVSQGMICAEDELGLGQSHDGIMILDETAEVGAAARTYFNIEDDIIYDIGLTPNRSDATSHLGVARDILAYLKINKASKAKIKSPDTSAFKIENTTKKITVDVLDTDACPRYAGFVIEGIQVGPSPDWLRARLESIGVRSINNIVDITNYVLHEYGQPLHAFDYDKIRNQKIVVRCLEADTPFLSLDEVERTLHRDDLMICDADENPMCIAGVFGGLQSGVTKDTTSIFLESAHFNAKYIRNTSTRHLLRTDAAKIFEKGSDPSICVEALKRAASLIKEITGAYVCSELIDIYPQEIKPHVIHLNYSEVQSLMGTNISKDEIHNILRALNMEISPVDADSIKVAVPTDKSDVLRSVDLIEEILRIYGFNEIEIPSKISSTLSVSNHPTKTNLRTEIATTLANAGWHEMMNLSLIESSYYKGTALEDQIVLINNTSNVHLNAMRPEMLRSGLLSIKHNLNRNARLLRYFEFGRSYIKSEEDYIETSKLTLFIAGEPPLKNWKSTDKHNTDFYDLKQAVARVLARFNILKYQVSQADDDRYAYGLNYHRGPKSIVTLGKVSSEVLKAMGIKTEVYFAEFDETALFKAQNDKLNLQEINKFPGATRDLALVLDEKTPFSDVEMIARKVDKKLLKDIKLFDVYKSEKHLGVGKKSYAINYSFENKERTLKDKEIDKIMNQLMAKYEGDLGAVIRK